MLITPSQTFIPKKKKAVAAGEPPVVPLELVSATYASETSVTLTFNQAITIAGLNTGYVTVADGDADLLLAGIGVGAMVGTDGVTIELEVTDPNGAPGVYLTVGAGNGIAAVNGGEAWSGVTELTLPFGE